MDERLLAPCTRALLEGWTGPVHGYVHRGIPTRAVCIGEFDGGMVMLWTQTGDAIVRPSDLSLDLSLAECEDRTRRVALGTPTPHRLAWLASHHCNVYRRPGHIAAAASEACAARFGGLYVPALAGIDLSGDPGLADRLALAAVWREVSRGK